MENSLSVLLRYHGAVTVIRNPLEVCKSHFNYARTHSHLKHVAAVMYKSRTFQHFCRGKIPGWAARIKVMARAARKRRHFLHYETLKKKGEEEGFESQLRGLADFLRYNIGLAHTVDNNS